MDWKLAHLDEIPALGAAATPEYWQQWTDGASYVQGWRSVREHLGIAAFGVNAKQAAEGETLVIAHREVDFGGQEELYVLLAGRARFELDGTVVELAAGEVLYVAPNVNREARALETPTTVLMIGAVPGAPYVPE
jgi:mannose-6-phosphate isomerase-like protein (cupin superfamily)